VLLRNIFDCASFFVRIDRIDSHKLVGKHYKVILIESKLIWHCDAWQYHIHFELYHYNFVSWLKIDSTL